jgi:LexA-binding, inner membrane-associated putative hydrolase
MMASGHALTGALLCGVVGPAIPSPMHPAVAVAVSAAVGAPLALLMDLDTKSTAYYMLIPLSWVLKPLLVTLAAVVYHATKGPKDPEDPGMHRMFTHQPEFALFLALVTLAATWGSAWCWWASTMVLVGVWAHRPGDACTKAGVPVSLTEVIRRRMRGEPKVWVKMGVPHVLRFVTGGKRGAKLFGAKSTRLWDMCGEKVVTFALAGLCCALGAATVLGFYPAW